MRSGRTDRATVGSRRGRGSRVSRRVVSGLQDARTARSTSASLGFVMPRSLSAGTDIPAAAGAEPVQERAGVEPLVHAHERGTARPDGLVGVGQHVGRDDGEPRVDRTPGRRPGSAGCGSARPRRPRRRGGRAGAGRRSRSTAAPRINQFQSTNTAPAGPTSMLSARRSVWQAVSPSRWARRRRDDLGEVGVPARQPGRLAGGQRQVAREQPREAALHLGLAADRVGQRRQVERRPAPGSTPRRWPGTPRAPPRGSAPSRAGAAALQHVGEHDPPLVLVGLARPQVTVAHERRGRDGGGQRLQHDGLLRVRRAQVRVARRPGLGEDPPAVAEVDDGREAAAEPAGRRRLRVPTGEPAAASTARRTASGSSAQRGRATVAA